MKRLAFLGPYGTFSEDAAKKYNEQNHYELVPMPTIYDVITSVDNGEIEEGIVPIENSIEGAVNATLDVLVRSKNIKITEEFDVNIVNNLIVKPGTALAEITDLYSFYQPIGQCMNYIRMNLPKTRIHGTNSTAEAAAFVSDYNEKNNIVAAIGTRNAAAIYNLEILAENINDYPDTVTRFVIIGHREQAQSGNDKTSIAFVTHADRPGGLYEILGVFSKRSINLTKIESRPSKESLGQYIFFLDMEGHKSDVIVGEALSEVQKIVVSLKILGSYPIKK
ncbi:MAG: prephenate dehydratase [Candidatus Margulisiibacteriota bacterium]|nr:MAG: hypothetical protein A2X43_07765 [Candidatus Margulisbacteria bacterium GWD2_39_127]OGI03881.1 MAG: hypothetical protein A2X42_09970 [Candidatus Margulisbacteria bacterium GWF2_38_17]OGI08814.1 MAG: hypothetical protein A2X41_05145 [Candidatus Margulisbacteria bacterium GWE2_39_32]PZM78645.1 MAG: prephenate dehydratase [Candidatus Margulisiibacteriota bacterium]HAR61987.1 prephenate dehydratase [Candidatus Margulisiibacteriota bacterium]